MKAGNYGSLIISASIFYSRQQNNQFSLSEICFEGKSPISTSVNTQKKETFCTLIKYQSSSPGSIPQENFPFLLSSSFSTTFPAEMNVASAKTPFNEAKINIIISNVKVSDLKKTLTLLNIKLQTKNNSKHLSKWMVAPKHFDGEFYTVIKCSVHFA